jgi:hypothetical protein
MVHAHEITAEEGANYLSETALLYEEKEYAPSTEFHDSLDSYLQEELGEKDASLF